MGRPKKIHEVEIQRETEIKIDPKKVPNDYYVTNYIVPALHEAFPLSVLMWSVWQYFPMSKRYVDIGRKYDVVEFEKKLAVMQKAGLDYKFEII